MDAVGNSETERNVLSPNENHDVVDANGAISEDIDSMRARITEMELEAARLRTLQSSLQQEGAGLEEEEKEGVDARSIFIGNVDYSTTPEDLQSFFQRFGNINRITILLDRYTGRPKG
jgi:polyadenylate-binding protein 2